MSRLPNFLIIGAARCGTTALYEYLDQHPAVFMSEPKEPHFFAFEGQAVNFRGAGDDRMINRAAVTSLPQYRRLFRRANDAHAVGEASVSYLYYERAIEGIRRHVPNARLICMLRDPADRAFSAYAYMRSRLFEPVDTFEAALAAEPSRMADHWHHIWHYRNQGFYAAQVERYLAAFPREQIRFYLFDEFRSDPSGVVSDALEFIGVDPSFQPERVPTPVASGTPRNPRLQRLVLGTSRLKGLARLVLTKDQRRAIQHRLLKANLQRERLHPDTRARLVADYRDDIVALEGLIGRDLSGWLKSA